MESIKNQDFDKHSLDLATTLVNGLVANGTLMKESDGNGNTGKPLTSKLLADYLVDFYCSVESAKERLSK